MSNAFRFAGACTALVTPFLPDNGRVDFDGFDALVKRQVESGIDGLVPCGTTGESPTLSDQEQAEVVQHTAAVVAGRVPVVAGASSNNTRHAVRLAQRALEAGADAVMVTMPYYNKPTQEGLIAHVTAVAREVGGAPVLLYNIPGRCAVDLSLDSLARILEACPNVFGVKDATGNVLRCQAAMSRFGERLTVMCGDDALTVAMMACGAKGVISVTSNLYPGRVAAVCKFMREGRWNEARLAHMKLLPVHDVMFVETSPGPVKAAMANKLSISPALRLPLVPPTARTAALVTDTLAAFESEAAE